MRFSKEQALDELPSVLHEFMDEHPAGIHRNTSPGLDATLEVGGHTFFVAIRNTGTLGEVVKAIEDLKRHKGPLRRFMLVVPHMTKAAREYCRDQSVSWVDLSGNGRIKAPGVLVKAVGASNRFASKPSPGNIFAPKSSRVVRQLLIAPQREYEQKELVKITGLQQSLVSRCVRNLREAGYLESNTRTIRLKKPAELLSAWREVYQFEKHSVLRGHISAQSGPALLETVVEHLNQQEAEYVATGLAGAWLNTHFANFRLVTLYAKHHLTKADRSEIGFRQTDKGANIWLVLPNDEGVFAGSSVVDGVPCVHPVQNYLDLKAQPERADEAAEELHRKLIE